ncbi:tetratricopeptide repeat protein [bacterium]|nr:tetratricopeptide repeat protein [bacterium]MBP9810953.1 tetratricopeptide repeat protein [bacterium]
MSKSVLIPGFVLFALVGVCLPASSSSSSSSLGPALTIPADENEELIKLAAAALSAHRYAEAEQNFRLAIENSPQLQVDSARLADLFNFLGVTLYCQQKHTEAIAAYKRALSGLPEGLTVDTRGKILSNLALSYSALGMRREALQACRSALDHFRLGKVDALSHSVLLNAYGQLLIDEKNWEAAKSVLTKSLRLRASVHGDSYELEVPLLKLASAYQGAGRYDLAESVLQRRSHLLEGQWLLAPAGLACSHAQRELQLSGNIRQDYP